jgi:predicted ATPase/class 3 adenylate cyclase
MSRLPTGTVTFLFTDIEGSTRLLQRLGEDYARVLGEHQALLRAAFDAHGGVEVDTQGDSFFVAFPSAPAAVAAAAVSTRALAAHAWPEGTTLRVRMGLHSGSPQLAGAGYVGLDVHRAARIAAAGHGGQILLSEATRALSEDALPADVSLRDLGPHHLKDLQEPERIAQLVLAGQPAEFPPLKTLDAHPHNLPLQPTPLLGREEQLAALSALLRQADVRLVTVTGPGGIGKTRLAIQVAAELVDAFSDGVWFVRLSPLVDPELVVPTIAQTLGLREAGSQPIAETLSEYLADKQLLLVLDNFEQVAGAAGALAALLAGCPGLRVVVTSRIRLRLRGEREYPLAPLSLPDPRHPPTPDALSQYAAVALFIQRATEARATFAVTVSNAPAIAEICARLDGLPLAIELAAARVKLLPPEALLARLTSQLALLTGGARDLEERQRTMRATIAWSYDLLSPAEQVLFRRLSVFVSGCAFEAAEVVCLTPAGAVPLDLDMLEGLAALVDHSLVRQTEEGGEPRFGLLHVIREYALERLEASGEAEAARRAHAGFVLDLVERAEPELTGPAAGAWLDRLEREHDNLRAALSWARERGEAETGLRVAAAVWRFWAARGHLREGRTWVEGLLAVGTGREVPDRVRARALLAGGALAKYQGDAAAAVSWLEQAVALGRPAGDPRTTASALNALGIIAREQDAPERAAEHYAASLALMREVGDRRGIAVGLLNLGVSAYDQHDLDRAAASYSEALALLREVGDREHVAVCLGNLGEVARDRGEVAEAAARGREALALDWALGERRRCAEVLEHLASTAGVARQGERAARLLGAATALREALGIPQPANERADVERLVAAARAAAGEAAWAAAWAAGHALALEEVVAEELGETSPAD